MKSPMEYRRYHLHRKIKDKGVKIISAKKTIFLPFGQEPCNDITELCKNYNYEIQLEIILPMYITTEQQNLIKKGFGKHYTGRAIQFLNGKQIFNKKGAPFTAPALKQIVGGTTQNTEVIDALTDGAIAMIDARKEREKLITKKAKTLLKD